MIKEREFMIWIDDGAAYHTSRFTTKFCREVGLLRINWLVQSPDLNPIENLWQIIKIRVSSRRHRIRSAKEMKIAIKEERERLT